MSIVHRTRPWLALLVMGACTTPTTTPTETASTQTGAQVVETPTPPATVDAPQAPAKAAPSAEKLAEEVTRETATGASFTAPKGWYITAAKDHILLEDPDRELQIWQLDMPKKALADAVAGAWKQVQPDFAYPVIQSVSPPAPDGWDEVLQVAYDVPNEKKLVIVGVARRKGDMVYVTLLHAPLATASRRGAQMQQIVTSLKVAGQDKESFAGKSAHKLDEARQAKLDSFIAEAMKQTGVPGAAVAVVQDGQVVFEKGYGVRKRGGKKKVTPRTLFMIGSTTKPLTSLLMAKLVDEGKVTWDASMVELLPGFGLADADIAGKVQLRHSVCACTGMPRQDAEFLFEFAGSTPDKRLAELRTMKPTTGFGETFQYSNPMVLAGGYAAARVAYPKLPLARAYDRAMRTMVFKPLGMKDTTFDHKRIKRREHASPHGRDLAGEYRPIPLSVEHAVISVAPAGGAWSTVRDLARYVQLELGKGVTAKGKRYIAEASLLARRERQVKITDDTGYGLALFVDKVREIAMIHHGGNTLGFTGQTMFLPDHGIGLVILSNAQIANRFTGAVQRRLLELLFDGADRARENLAHSLKTEREERAVLQKRMTDPAPKDWVAPLIGKYRHPALGALELSWTRNGAVIDVGEWRTVVVQVKDAAGVDTLVTRDGPIAGLPLEIDGTALVLDLGQQQYRFTRE